MNRFLKSAPFKTFCVVMAALILGMIIAFAGHSNSSFVTAAVGTVMSPVQRATAFVSEKLTDFGLFFRSSSSLQKRVDELEGMLADYQDDLVGYEQAKQKVALYEEFLDLKESHMDYTFASASIIGQNGANTYSTFVLSKGSTSGIHVNDPVLSGHYLVGVVTAVQPTQCTVSTILNPDVNVSAYEARTQEVGFVTTTVDLSKKGLCRLPGLERTTTIAPGGIVCTSGLGGIYPADLIIGTVLEVINDTADISSYAVVTPGVDFTQLRDVFVLTDFAEKTDLVGEQSAAD